MVHPNGEESTLALDVALFQELRASLGNELKVVTGLYRRFLDNTAGTLDELRAQSVTARAKSLHALKGSAAMLGANRIAAIAAKLQENPDASDSEWSQLDRELTAFHRALNAHLESLGHPALP